MFHTKFHQNWIMNEDFENNLREGEGGADGGNNIPYFFQKNKFHFENQRLSELFNTIEPACKI